MTTGAGGGGAGAEGQHFFFISFFLFCFTLTSVFVETAIVVFFALRYSIDDIMIIGVPSGGVCCFCGRWLFRVYLLVVCFSVLGLFLVVAKVGGGMCEVQ